MIVYNLAVNPKVHDTHWKSNIVGGRECCSVFTKYSFKIKCYVYVKLSLQNYNYLHIVAYDDGCENDQISNLLQYFLHFFTILYRRSYFMVIWHPSSTCCKLKYVCAVYTKCKLARTSFQICLTLWTMYCVP